MSWSYIINGSVQEYELDRLVIEDAATQHLGYPADMLLALRIAKAAGFRTCVCTGFRTPNPYGGDETAEITVRGTAMPVDYIEMTRRLIAEGPDEVALAERAKAVERTGEGTGADARDVPPVDAR